MKLVNRTHGDDQPTSGITSSSRNIRVEELERQVARLEAENRALKMENEALRRQVGKRVKLPTDEQEAIPPCQQQEASQTDTLPKTLPSTCTKLTAAQIERYSRQLLVAEGFGVQGQLSLLNASVLVIGAGGIGSTVLLYLAAAGVGHLSVIDFDVVEKSNLHRQVIHEESRVGVNKAVSACQTLQQLNPSIECHALNMQLTHDNALDLVRQHTCVVDASDNPRTRFLVNDACVLAGKPLISGSAIGTEGQLSVYNYPPTKNKNRTQQTNDATTTTTTDNDAGGPCYRCLYPQPSITAGSKSCSDNGVLGPVPGLIGILQALEVIKVLTNTGTAMNERLLMYDALQCSFLNIKKPKKQSKCPVCSHHATISTMNDSYHNLQSSRGPASCDMYTPAPLDDQYQITCEEYNHIFQQRSQQHLLLDVRVKEQFDLCALDHAVNIPLDHLLEKHNLEELQSLTNNWTNPIYCICRRGVFSVEATKLLQERLSQPQTTSNQNDGTCPTLTIKNIKGGYEAWRKQVDRSFPSY